MKRRTSCGTNKNSGSSVLGTIALLIVLSAPSTAAETDQTPTFAPVGARYVIDVRTQAEWVEAHIPGAILIPHDRIAEHIAVAVPDRSTPIALFCRSGGRSSKSGQILRELGYSNVVNYGGIDDARARVASALDCKPRTDC